MDCSEHGMPPPSLRYRQFSSQELQAHHTVGVIATLSYLGLEGCSRVLSATDGAHQICNLLSLHHDLRLFFGRLDLWFEDVGMVCYPETSH